MSSSRAHVMFALVHTLAAGSGLWCLTGYLFPCFLIQMGQQCRGSCFCDFVCSAHLYAPRMISDSYVHIFVGYIHFEQRVCFAGCIAQHLYWYEFDLYENLYSQVGKNWFILRKVLKRWRLDTSRGSSQQNQWAQLPLNTQLLINISWKWLRFSRRSQGSKWEITIVITFCSLVLMCWTLLFF